MTTKNIIHSFNEAGSRIKILFCFLWISYLMAWPLSLIEILSPDQLQAERNLVKTSISKTASAKSEAVPRLQPHVESPGVQGPQLTSTTGKSVVIGLR